MEEVLVCKREGCDVVIETKKTHNQIYCCDECCRLATNAKIMEKYYQKRAQRMGLARQCVVCENSLSRYNSENICHSCSLDKEAKKKQDLMSMLFDVNWQE